jgi:hypothetical protein
MGHRARPCQLPGSGPQWDGFHLPAGTGWRLKALSWQGVGIPGVCSHAVPSLAGQGEGRAVPGKTGAPYKEEKGESTKGSICPFSPSSITNLSSLCNRIMVLYALVLGCAVCEYPSET